MQKERTQLVTLLFLLLAVMSLPTTLAQAAISELKFPVAFVPESANTIAFSESDRLAFATSFHSDSLFAFDTQTGNLISSISTGDGPSFIALSEQGSGRIIGVTNIEFIGSPPASLSFIDATDPSQMTTISTVTLPLKYLLNSTDRTLIISTDGQLAFVVVKTNAGKALLLSIKIATGQIVDQLNLAVGSTPLNAAHINVAGNERLVFALNGTNSEVAIVDIGVTGTLKLSARVKLPGGAILVRENNLAVSRDGSRAYLAAGNADLIFAIDLTTARISAQLSAGQFPLSLDLLEVNGKQRIAVTAAIDGSVNIFEATTTTNLTKIATFKSASQFLTSAPVLNSDGRGFVATQFGQQLYTFNALTGEPLANIMLESSPDNLFASAGTDKQLATISIKDHRVMLFDTTTSKEPNQTVVFAPAGINFDFTENILFSRDNRRAFVASPISNELLIVDTTTRTISNAISVGQNPIHIAIAETANLTRVATINTNSTSVSLVQIDADGARLTGSVSLSANAATLDFINVVFSNDGLIGYVSDGVSKILAFDAVSGALLDTLDVGAQPIGLALFERDNQRRLAVVTFLPDQTSAVIFIDAATGLRETARYQAEPKTKFALNNNAVFSSDGRFIFITASFSLEFLSIDTTTARLINKLTGIIAPQLTLFNNNGNDRLIAVDVGAGRIHLIDIDENGRSKIGTRIKPPKDRFFTVGNNALIDPLSNRVYLADYGGARLLVFDPGSGNLIETIALIDGPGNIALSADGRHAVVLNTNGQANAISIIDF